MKKSIQKKDKVSFIDTLNTMPEPLRNKALKQFGSSICLLGITILAIIYTSDITCCIGFLLSLIVLYTGLDIVWKWADEKIELFRVKVYKSKSMRNGMINIMVRDATISDEDILTTDFKTFSYTIPVSKKTKGLINEGTILDIYLNPANPTLAVTYEIVG